MVSSNFSLQNQNKAETCPKIRTGTQPRRWAICYSQQKKNGSRILFFTPITYPKFQPVYPAWRRSSERQTLETCARNTEWPYTKIRMLWEDLDISERDKGLTFVFCSMPYFEYWSYFYRIRPLCAPVWLE